MKNKNEIEEAAIEKIHDIYNCSSCKKRIDCKYYQGEYSPELLKNCPAEIFNFGFTEGAAWAEDFKKE